MLRRLIHSAAVLGAVGAGALSPAAGQRVDPNRIIDLHVNAEALNQAFDGSTFEGKRFRISFAGHGTYEISPVVVDAAARRFRLTIFKGPENAPTEELRQVEQVEARLGVPVAIRSMPTVSVIVDGTRQRRASLPAGVQGGAQLASFRGQVRQSLATFSGECCVTCGQVTACGCAVGHSCGSCCSDACCPPPEEEEKLPPPLVLLQAPRSFQQMIGRCGKQVKDEERILTPRANRTFVASR